MGVLMQHPETGGTFETVDINGDDGETQAAHYETLGWERVEPEPVKAAEMSPEEPVEGHQFGGKPLSAYTKAEVQDVADEHGIEGVSQSSQSKDEMVEAVEAGLAAQSANEET